MGYDRIVGTMNPRSKTQLHCVFDLDSCLIETMPDSTESVRQRILTDPKYMSVRQRMYKLELYDVSSDKGKGLREDYWGVQRPHLNEFLLFSFSYFKSVSVWSAGRKEYVDALVDKIFSDFPSPYIVMNYDDIAHLPNGEYHKPLSKVYEIDPSMNPTNTILLDNRAANFINNPNNGVHIPDYSPSPNPNALMVDDIALLSIS